MRVIAGKARSLRLKTVPGLGTRPTTDRIKETLFNMLQPLLADGRFLDLFAGSGGIGIEALSRGAAQAVFVERERQALRCIEENLTFTRLKDQAQVLGMDVFRALRQLEGQPPFSCIFMDPPYGQDLEKQVLEYLSSSALADENSLIVVEADISTDFSYLESLHMTIERRKEYKTNVHLFIRKIQE
ncbi:MAG TPA: 16S rRNA (guanine(966)-N(2))-methyltransferase RsmD [Candidatus Egerieimonas intestinavium]|uniref:16S rRNA (Guanine(966)-N(2))-methyltransferase RsmD n=1 Tax=Candidatus Egerieimonas intestinavium TaxID=2840777 RepID=A0A9D1JFR0_9FIRM|nr:16S rRNA (guanine(966)-N(2))-methyltransferase RsmD [Candidatus Egerieimonas intestinavium]